VRPLHLALGILLVCGGLLALHGARPPYDDALFFVRFARNTLTHGVPGWNVADGPVFGNTSQLQQLLATAAWAVAPDHVVTALRTISAAGLATAAGLLGAARAAPRPTLPHAAAIVLALTGPVALGTLHSGMETAAAIALGAAFLWARPHSALAAAALGVGLVATRPDAGLLAGGTLLADALRTRRGTPLVAFAAGVLLLLAAAFAVYGTPLPTAFGAKAAGSALYDPTFLARCRAAKLEHALLFAASTVPLAARWRGATWPVWGPALAFVAFHELVTIDVMGMHARFLAPALPWFVQAGHGSPRRDVLAVWGALTTGAWATGLLPDATGWSLGRVPAASYVVLLGCGTALAWLPAVRPRIGSIGVVAMGVAAGLAWLSTAPVALAPPASDDGLARALEDEVTSFRGLERLARCFPPDIVVLHSEIGVPGVRLPEARIVDLGGLMHPELSPETLDARCLEEQPDAIFLPHRNYAASRAALRQGRCLDGYLPAGTRGSSPLWIRADRRARWASCTD
jgi:hypothetical protein